MKRKVKVILIILTALIVASIVGLCIYLNTPVPDAKHGIIFKVSDVSSTGLKLHMERKSGTSRPYVWTAYKMQKWYPSGWEPVELNQTYSYSENVMLSVTENFSHTWDLDWAESCGRLSTGFYRIEKGVGSESRRQTYYAPFFVIDWWEVLAGIAVVALIVTFFIIKRKKIYSIVLVTLFAICITGFALYLNVPIKDPEWGISFRVKESSPTGATFELTRQDDGDKNKLTTSGYADIERWSFWGWKRADLLCDYEPDTCLGLYDVTSDFSQIWKIKWEGYGKKLSNGLYRIRKVVTVKTAYEEGSGEQLQLNYSVPIVVVDWWEIATYIVALFFSCAVIYLLRRFRVWNLLGKYRNTVAITFLTILTAGWLASTFFAGKISSARHGYDVMVENANGGSVEGTIKYTDNEKYDTTMFLKTSRFYCLEKRTLTGWKKMREIPEVDNITVKEGNTEKISFGWASYYEPLLKGTYRIRQPFELWSKQDGTTDTGDIYIVFKVE